MPMSAARYQVDQLDNIDKCFKAGLSLVVTHITHNGYKLFIPLSTCACASDIGQHLAGYGKPPLQSEQISG
jgi:hypothetical protein